VYKQLLIKSYFIRGKTKSVAVAVLFYSLFMYPPLGILSSVLVARMGELMKRIGMESQVGFRWDRGTIDGLFTLLILAFLSARNYGLCSLTL